MSFSPSGTIYLCSNVSLDKDYKNVINFGSASEQLNFFTSKSTVMLDQYTYARKDNVIKVGVNYEELYNVDYVVYRNYATSKWIYCFITDKRYINESNTELQIETDVYQTYLFNAELLKSFVVREHVTSDTVGEHLVDEGLETGEHVTKIIYQNHDLDELYYVMGVTIKTTEDICSGGLYGNVYSGIRYTAYKGDSSGTTMLNSTITSLSAQGKLDTIVVIFAIPKLFLPSIVGDNIWKDIPYGADTNYKTISYNFPKNTIDGYTPKNKKCFTSPFTYLYVSNNNGGYAKYDFEDFANNDVISFLIGGNIAPNPTGFCVPKDYKKEVFSWEHSLKMEGYPLCSWGGDTYANWLAQNRGSLALNLVASTGAIVGGLVTANAVAVGGGVMGILSQMSNIQQHAIQPNQAKGNTGSGSLNCAHGIQSFYFSQVEIKAQAIERIDNFFEMFGYKVNALKVPNTNNRPNWNYVQTIDVNIKGNIPQKDMLKLKDIYNKGVTIWHSDNVGNYALNNH